MLKPRTFSASSSVVNLLSVLGLEMLNYTKIQVKTQIFSKDCLVSVAPDSLPKKVKGYDHEIMMVRVVVLQKVESFLVCVLSGICSDACFGS